MRKLRNFGLFIGVFLVLSGCTDFGTETKAPEEDDIRETVFRYQFVNNGSGFPGDSVQYRFLRITVVDTSDLYVLSFQDPSDEFMKRFAGETPVVEKASMSIWILRLGVRDKRTGAPGLRFDVGQIRWTSDVEAEVEGGYYATVGSASWEVFYVRKIRGFWWVYSNRVRGMS